MRATIFLIGVAKDGSPAPEFGGPSIVADGDGPGVADIDRHGQDFDQVLGAPVGAKSRRGDIGFCHDTLIDGLRGAGVARRASLNVDPNPQPRS